MDFCKECGSRLEPKKIKSGKQTMLVLACSKCGEKINQANETKINSKIITHNPKQMVSVIDKEKQLSTLPTIRFTCLRCETTTLMLGRFKPVAPMNHLPNS